MEGFKLFPDPNDEWHFNSMIDVTENHQFGDSIIIFIKNNSCAIYQVKLHIVGLV